MASLYTNVCSAPIPPGSGNSRRYHDLVGATRYRCSSCGNLTRFDVVERRRTRAFHHYSVSGELIVDEVEVLEAEVESVTCRWCGPPGLVAEVTAPETEAAS